MPLQTLHHPYNPTCHHDYQNEYPKLAFQLGNVKHYVYGDRHEGLVSCAACGGEHLCEHDYGDWESVFDHQGRPLSRNVALQATCKDCGYTHPCTHTAGWASDHGLIYCKGACGQTPECEDCGELLNGSACACPETA